MRSLASFASTFAFGFGLAQASCPPLQNDFFVDVQDLYAESADWSPETCRLYLSSSYNCSLVIFDPYTNTSEVLAIPGLTNHGNFSSTEYHLAGVDFDHYTGQIYITAASASAFDSTGNGDYSNANYTGPNRLLQFAPARKQFTMDIDLGPAQQAYLNQTGHRTSGFQDVAETQDGSAYAIGTFGSSIVKIASGTKIPELWYAPDNYVGKYGFGGLFSLGDKLVVSDEISGGFVTFDTSTAKPCPKKVALQNLPSNYAPIASDGLLAPSKYCGAIALWSDDYNGTSVYGSADNWESAQFLGLVLNDSPAAKGGFAVATFEAGDSIYALNEFFQFQLPQQPMNSFPMFDITKEVERIVNDNGFEELIDGCCKERRWGEREHRHIV